MLTFVKEDVDIVDSAPPAIRLILFAILAVEKRKKKQNHNNSNGAVWIATRNKQAVTLPCIAAIVANDV